MKPIEKTVARLLSVFGEPKTPDPALFIEEFTKAMKGVDPLVLEKAADRWMKRDTPFWPRPGELLAEAENVAADIYADKLRAKLAGDRYRQPEPVDEATIARVNAMVGKAIEEMKKEGHVVGKASETQWERGREREFRAMQERSGNRHLHGNGLSPISKRMVGGRE